MSVGMLLGSASVAALLTGAYWGSGFIFSKWADNDRFFTKVKEGTGKVIVKGKTFHRAILSLAGHHLNEPGKPWFDKSQPAWEILPDEPGKNYDDRMHLTKEFGLFWVGIPGMRSVYHYQFEWNEYKGTSEGEQELWHRNEDTSIFKANDFTYVMVLENVKTSDNVPVRAEFAVILQITNPYLALFGADNWKTLVESYIDRQGRNFIGTFTYDQLRSETDKPRGEDGFNFHECHEENFSKPIVKLTFELPEEKVCDATAKPKGLKGKHGITIKAANMAEIDLFGVFAVENEKSSVLEFTAKRQAEATRVTADAQAYATVKAADASAYDVAMQGGSKALAARVTLREYARHPELAKASMAAEAMGKPGEGKTVVIPSDIGKVLEGVFGGRG